MISGWKNVHLSDCLTLGNGKPRPLSYGNIPVYGGNGILDYCDSYNYSDGTIIIGRVGAYCGSVYISYDKIWISDNALSAKPLKNNDIIFLYYYLLNMGLNQFSEGSSHPLLTHSLLYSLDASIPELDEQRAIAAVLSSLDDKIDLLHRQNATLEAMAEALFRQWFVVEAKEEWEDGILGDILQLIYGKNLREEDRSGTGYPVVGSNGVVGYHDNFLVDAPGIVIGRKGTLGKVILLDKPFYPIDTTFYVKSIYNFDALFFLYFLLKSINFEELNTDSAVPGLNRNIAHTIEIKKAPVSIIKKFECHVSPLFKKINRNQIQINTLEKLRDTLLPKLMSGEVRVAIS